MKKQIKRISSGGQWLLTTIIACSFLFSQSASAGFDWNIPSVTVVKEGNVSGDFFIGPIVAWPAAESFTLAPGDTPRIFDVPGVFYVGEKMKEMVDITIVPTGDLFGGLELRNILGFEYAGYAGVCKGDCTVTFTNVSQVPLPAAAWLFGSGLIGLASLARRRKTAT